jgi:hypothetical protein
LLRGVRRVPERWIELADLVLALRTAWVVDRRPQRVRPLALLGKPVFRRSGEVPVEFLEDGVSDLGRERCRRVRDERDIGVARHLFDEPARQLA